MAGLDKGGHTFWTVWKDVTGRKFMQVHACNVICVTKMPIGIVSPLRRLWQLRSKHLLPQLLLLSLHYCEI